MVPQFTWPSTSWQALSKRIAQFSCFAFPATSSLSPPVLKGISFLSPCSVLVFLRDAGRPHGAFLGFQFPPIKSFTKLKHGISFLRRRSVLVFLRDAGRSHGELPVFPSFTSLKSEGGRLENGSRRRRISRFDQSLILFPCTGNRQHSFASQTAPESPKTKISCDIKLRRSFCFWEQEIFS
jgi:hypothetical protein